MFLLLLWLLLLLFVEANDTWWLPTGVFGVLWNENENKQTNEHNNWTLFPICRTSARASLPPFSLPSFTWCMLTSKARSASRSTKPFNVSRTFSRPCCNVYSIYDLTHIFAGGIDARSGTGLAIPVVELPQKRLCLRSHSRVLPDAC